MTRSSTANTAHQIRATINGLRDGLKPFAHSSKYTWPLICALIDNLLFSHPESYKQIGRRRWCDAVNIAFRQRRSFPTSYQVRSDD